MEESVFTYAAPRLKFGAGASVEIGFELRMLGARRVLIVTDAGVAATGHPARIAERLAAEGCEVAVFTGAHVEPTDDSMLTAVEWARDEGPFDAIVAVGGGSSIDTAKAVNLLTTNDGGLEDYLNKPVGAGRAPTRPLLPLVAVPTTTGTGSESTTICVLDVLALKVKTGISHAALRPTVAVVDPDLTMTQPPGVTAAAGLDILCHALESYTARPYTAYPRKRPEERVPYCGANPVADVFCEKAVGLLARSFRTAWRDGDDAAARSDMALAATLAGMGFGNAGVHVPHANAYPIAGLVRDFRPAGYPDGAPLVPHGMAVSLTAPAAFELTYSSNPARHDRLAALLGGPDVAAGPTGLADRVRELMADLEVPSRLGDVGYDTGDVEALVEGSLRQQRLLATAPLDVGADELRSVFRASL
ncbi:iron-containing alcohol dehydrogenase [Nostocoides sp. F2B08]|uniref:hydroxyacid-oxoacid transhydrogenase n=1 Tax=Nostocoides sp. F2B08 TaxID=2653936 RepID=UPI0012631A7A|nr:hydroxyacid-oxoacid transhydrogenase [Tetrasphaera sp. F2B08]KAB7741385.1 iron-containing alcohol dehydrogenase [Tetrasphaera sp. F2B08]